MSVELAESLCYTCEFKGGHTRLDGLDHLVTDEYVPSLDPATLEVFWSIPWKVSSSHMFKESAHVNLQELGEMVCALRRLAKTHKVPTFCSR